MCVCVVYLCCVYICLKGGGFGFYTWNAIGIQYTQAPSKQWKCTHTRSLWGQVIV